MSFQRFDKGELKKAHMTPQGYLKADAYATRSGIFIYRKADGSIQREYRPESEVFAKESMDSLQDIYMTNDHPQNPLTSTNTKLLNIGHTGSRVDKEEKFIKTGVTVHEQNAVDAVMTGKKTQLSCGYICDLDFTPGEFDGQHYDAIQKNIRYNHLALVKEGRAGPKAAIKLDKAEGPYLRNDDAMMVLDDEENNSMKTDGDKKSVVRCDEDAPYESPHEDSLFQEEIYIVKNDVISKLEAAATKLDIENRKKDSCALLQNRLLSESIEVIF